MTKKNLIEDVNVTHLQLVEGEAEKTGKVVVRGEFGTYNKPTANNRFYSEDVWKSQIGRLNEAMKGRRVFGHADHPENGRTSLKEVSHIVTDMRLENGILVGEAEILPTVQGKQLEALLRSGCSVGVSSRGFGSVKSNDKGWDVVQEDYKLVTFDFVADPADSTAYPKACFEGAEFIEGEALVEGGEQPAYQEPEKTDHDEPKANDELKAPEATKTATMEPEGSKEPKGEPENMPKIEGASIETIAALMDNMREAANKELQAQHARHVEELSQLRAENAEIAAERDKLAQVAKEVAYKFYMERALAGEENADMIRTLVGDVSKFASAAELKDRVNEVREAVAKDRAAIQNQVTAELKIAEENATKQAAQISELQAALQQLAESNKRIANQLLTERKLRNNPESAKIRSVLEKVTSLKSEKDLDSLIEDFRPATPKDSDDAQNVRARVRKTLNSNTVEYKEEASPKKTTPSNQLVEDLNGVSVEEILSLSGTPTRTN